MVKSRQTGEQDEAGPNKEEDNKDECPVNTEQSVFVSEGSAAPSSPLKPPHSQDQPVAAQPALGLADVQLEPAEVEVGSPEAPPVEGVMSNGDSSPIPRTCGQGMQMPPQECSNETEVGHSLPRPQLGAVSGATQCDGAPPVTPEEVHIQSEDVVAESSAGAELPSFGRAPASEGLSSPRRQPLQTLSLLGRLDGGIVGNTMQLTAAPVSQEAVELSEGFEVLGTWKDSWGHVLFDFSLGRRCSGFVLPDAPVLAEQWRGGSLIWVGTVRLFEQGPRLKLTSPGAGACGRRTPAQEARAEQWAVGDIIYIPGVLQGAEKVMLRDFQENMAAYTRELLRSRALGVR